MAPRVRSPPIEHAVFADYNLLFLALLASIAWLFILVVPDSASKVYLSMPINLLLKDPIPLEVTLALDRVADEMLRGCRFDF